MTLYIYKSTYNKPDAFPQAFDRIVYSQWRERVMKELLSWSWNSTPVWYDGEIDKKIIKWLNEEELYEWGSHDRVGIDSLISEMEITDRQWETLINECEDGCDNHVTHADFWGVLSCY